MDYILSPSLLAANFAELGESFRELQEAQVRWLHLDVMDGLFVPNLSMGLTVISSVRKVTSLFFDVHLMITDPIRYVEAFAKAGADLINFHLEACDDPQAVIDAIKKTGKKVGITVKPETPLEKLIPYLGEVDMVLVMGVEPGFGGQSYIPATTDRLRTLRRMISERGLATSIEIDGGVSLRNIHEVLDAGCNIVVVGSAVFKGDISENAGKFIKILDEYKEKSSDPCSSQKDS